MWFLFGEVSSSSGCLGWATLFYCGTPWAFHIIIFHGFEEWVWVPIASVPDLCILFTLSIPVLVLRAGFGLFASS